ncbi:hypothetical protein RBB79_10185 [Tunturiibacter empetritectus]|uniref:Uncharacterized protein n=1 Tax=Tunturiibacter lichenicola TaxID=2051959 RepID=A0A852VIB0_9BACT|nr:hypothetical protein [Edaphobacter lichenicola]NYF89925.1 hypothetical protein [Edaphobacter lichenicola]
MQISSHLLDVAQEIQEYEALNEKLGSGTASVSFPYQVDSKHWDAFTVRERLRYNNQLSDSTLSWRCGIDDVLTLSVGVMFTTLPYRTYVSQSVPTSTGTQNVLVVNGNSNVSPQGLALLNYKLYVLDKGPQPGLAFSTGPVFKFGSTPSVSNFGWFAGGSFSL